MPNLNVRFNGHRQGFNNPDRYGCCKILCEHFTNGLCENAEYTVQIIEKLDGNGRTDRKAINPNDTKIRKEREKHWMLKLRTVYPYGLNDRIGDEFKIEKNVKLIASQFPKLDRQFIRETKGNRKGNNHTSSESFMEMLINLLHHNIPDAMNYIRSTLASIRKRTLKEIAELLNDIVAEDEYNVYLHWYLAAIDTIESKLYKPPTEKPISKRRSDNFKVSFVNKAVEMINIPRLLHSPALSLAYPKQVGSYDAPTVVYNLEDTIASKIFNFNKFVKELDLTAFLQDETILPCNCHQSPFIDTHHQHIITGNLRLVANNKLRKLFSKGPKYREQVPINFQNAKDEIMGGMDAIISRWTAKAGVETIIFQDFKHEFEQLIDDRINNLKNNIHQRTFVPIMEQHEVKSALKQLQNQYVISPIDKATGNVSFICKRFYANVLVEELGLRNPHADLSYSTYVQVSDSDKDHILSEHQKELKDLFNINTDDDNLVLPNMYWLPKKHKIPSKSRFIVAAAVCSLKPLAKAVTAILKLFQKQIQNYNLKSHFFSGVKTFWVVQDKQPIIDAIHKINKRRNAKSITTYDFSTLYTNIPHNKLIDVMNELTDFCFKGCSDSKILVDKYGAFWKHQDDTNIRDDILCFTKSKVKQAITYLLANCYFTVGSFIFRQCIGIPMGSDPAPFMANLFLYSYESKFLKGLKKIDLSRARRFGNVFRFIDDLNALNDNSEFERCYKEIYPPELELKKENVDIHNASFLDLDISIVDGKFVLKLYDKRDAFPFSIVRMPFLSSNIPSRIFYAALGGELLRIARCTTDETTFLNNSIKLIDRMYLQGAEISRTRNTIYKTYNKHQSSFLPFFNTPVAFVNDILFGSR